MKLTNIQTHTSANEASFLDDPWAIEAFGGPVPVAAGSIEVTQTTWERQLEWMDYPRWLLCRLYLIHRPHCHAYSGYGWYWRMSKEEKQARASGRLYGVTKSHYWDPRDWWFWFVGDCNRCGHPDCLNYGDC